eukprot:TRINITY_DN41771_c0_g1_i1.p1 TRINITY_DN41771_c0_g1~~TRINITY_DN41771_c0_g1_i1.p1  ORF type:complete len:317 (+),score=31.65 TRINITY_DN41771_c0_g1_i1:75-1025(+)
MTWSLRCTSLLVFSRCLFSQGVSNKQAQRLNREECTEEKLRWDVLEPEAAAKTLRTCGIVFWGKDTLEVTDEFVNELNISAHEFLRRSPRSQRVKAGHNRDGRESLIPGKDDAPFDISLMRRFVQSPIGKTLKLYFDGRAPGLSYVELWWTPSGVGDQEIHTDGSGGSLIVFWLLDDLGTRPLGKNGEFVGLPGCFNPPDGRIARWCAKVEDKRVNEVNFTKLNMQAIYQPALMGSGFVYDTNLLHAGAGNKSPRKKLAYTFSVHGRSQDSQANAKSEMDSVVDIYGRKAQALNSELQRAWDQLYSEGGEVSSEEL